jgi:hypothetical protein
VPESAERILRGKENESMMTASGKTQNIFPLTSFTVEYKPVPGLEIVMMEKHELSGALSHFVLLSPTVISDAGPTHISDPIVTGMPVAAFFDLWPGIFTDAVPASSSMVEHGS